MDVATMLKVISDAHQPKTATRVKGSKYNADEAKRLLYAELDHVPATKRELMRATGLSESFLYRALEEMVRCGSAVEVFPGEFGRRALYIKGK